MTQYLVKSRLFDGWLTLDDVGGTGGELATLSMRDCNSRGEPGKRQKRSVVNRAELIGLAFELLEVSDQMLSHAAFATSKAKASPYAEPMPRNRTFLEKGNDARGYRDTDDRRRDVSTRYQRLRDRISILHRTQRVLEECSDEVAETLDALVTIAQHTGPKAGDDNYRHGNRRSGAFSAVVMVVFGPTRETRFATAQRSIRYSSRWFDALVGHACRAQIRIRGSGPFVSTKTRTCPTHRTLADLLRPKLMVGGREHAQTTTL